MAGDYVIWELPRLGYLYQATQQPIEPELNAATEALPHDILPVARSSRDLPGAILEYQNTTARSHSTDHFDLVCSIPGFRTAQCLSCRSSRSRRGSAKSMSVQLFAAMPLLFDAVWSGLRARLLRLLDLWLTEQTTDG